MLNIKVPSVDEYAKALNALDLKPLEIKVLRSQFKSPYRAITSQKVCEIAKYPGIGPSNLLYGNLGKKLAKQLGIDSLSGNKKKPKWWGIMSTGDSSKKNFTWVMREELAEALIELKLVDPKTDGGAKLPDVDIDETNFEVAEGKKHLLMHIRRERNRRLIALKKKLVRDHRCEICKFDFFDSYGIDYCEVHHLTPLGNLQDETKTKLEDLAIVCANCHRIIHSTNPPYTIKQMKAKVTTTTNIK
ncbi:MAG: HNH endonuclease [Pirellulaceae bacterium]